ncbi:MAG: hypothetical protein ACE5FQ_09375 [Thiogranum sp.]
MTLIMDMASGEEYRGDELGFPRAVPTVPGPEGNAPEAVQHVQLQLATVEVAPSRQQTSIDMAGVDIATLIQTVDD